MADQAQISTTQHPNEPQFLVDLSINVVQTRSLHEIQMGDPLMKIMKDCM